jgi:octaprenyl-diphosphate synthase
VPPRRETVLTALASASEGAGLATLATRLEAVRTMVASDLNALDAEVFGILDAATRDGDLAKRAAVHLLSRPGKRLRPLCALIAAELCGVRIDDRLRQIALVSELVHAATLLHDDVIDEGRERRGGAAARVVYSNSASILGGDWLLIAALERVAAIDDRGGRAVLAALLDTIGRMVAAEAIQLEMRQRFAPSRRIYFEIIDGKTASLFRWSFQAAALLHHQPGWLQRAMARAGGALGQAFQLVDDALDLEGDAARTGKDLFADLRQGKLTWPLLWACERDARLQELVARTAAGDDDLAGGEPPAAEEIAARIIGSGAVQATRKLARGRAAVARRALARLADSPARRALDVIVDAAVERRG